MSTRSKPICVLLSGGLDSALMLHRMLRQHRRVIPLYVRCGFHWEPAELRWVRRLLRAMRHPRLAPLEVVELPLRSLYGAHWSFTGRGTPGARTADAAVYLPGRNALLISAAAIRCADQRLGAIALGILRSNPFGDATPAFFSGLARTLTRALGHRLRILTPLRAMTKTQAVRAPGVPFHLTFSCLQPQRGLRHCGRCNKCAERRRAFRAARVPDPTRYRW